MSSQVVTKLKIFFYVRRTISTTHLQAELHAFLRASRAYMDKYCIYQKTHTA